MSALLIYAGALFVLALALSVWDVIQVERGK